VQLSPSQPSYEEAMHRTRLLLEIENTSKIFHHVDAETPHAHARTSTHVRVHHITVQKKVVSGLKAYTTES